MTSQELSDIYSGIFYRLTEQEGHKIMLTAEKLSRRPMTFRRLTGVDVKTFYEIAERTRPLWEERRDNFEAGG